MSASSIPAVLRERSSLQPNDTAFTFIDYEHDWNGVTHSLTWGQLYRRTVNLASELTDSAAPGDRAVIIAPQGLDYLVAFLASLHAGMIAVPLSMPAPGVHDERVSAVLSDATPKVILTTSAHTDGIGGYLQPTTQQPEPALLAVDSLDLDTRRKTAGRAPDRPQPAYLQYTSGSTRTPAGVMVADRNLSANFEQMVSDFFRDRGGVAPPDTTVVSWLPFYHDMGLLLGICAPILGGWHTVFTTPLAFLARPARWMQMLASNPRAVSAAPNFAFELAAARTSDADMAGLDLGDVLAIMSGSERVHETTLRRYIRRFTQFNLPAKSIRPSYGLAEATLYVATHEPGEAPIVVHFEPEKMSAGHAKRSGNDVGAPLVTYGVPRSPAVRIVDPETTREQPADSVGEIWVRGENVCLGYWQKPDQTERTFNAMIADPTPGTDAGPWLRTGDLGFFSNGELFVMGRIKDLLIVRGRNHYPDDIEATIQEITGGRVAAIAVEEDRTEQLVAIIEVKQRGDSEESVKENLLNVKNQVTSAISQAHGLSAADLVLVPSGSIPITTSGKVRRAACAERYRNGEFARLD